MQLKQAIDQFVKAHKPERLDTYFITEYYGGLAEYIQHKASDIDSAGLRYVEIPAHDSASGNPVLIEWEGA